MHTLTGNDAATLILNVRQQAGLGDLAAERFRMVQVGCGLPVMPSFLWDTSPYLSLAPGPVT